MKIHKIWYDNIYGGNFALSRCGLYVCHTTQKSSKYFNHFLPEGRSSWKHVNCKTCKRLRK